MTQPSPDSIWDVLVQECGATNNDRAAFANHIHNHHGVDEWRFMGALGFGGKVRWPHPDERPPTVDCYREDETPERLAMIDRANVRLAKLYADPLDGDA